MNKESKMKPVMFVKSKGKYYRNNEFQQNVLLEALQHTDDLDELKKIAKFHTKAEVLRTLDKLSIRKGFHDALEKNGLDLNYLVEKFKGLCDSDSEKISLGAANTMIKSLGLDKYDVTESSGKNWEELLVDVIDKEREEGTKQIEGVTQYDVKRPEVPEEELKKQKEESELGKSLYE